MAEKKHRTIFQKSTAAIDDEGRKQCFKLTRIDVADTTTQRRERAG